MIMKKEVNSNPVLKFREENRVINSSDGKGLKSQGTMITETRERIDTSESSLQL